MKVTVLEHDTTGAGIPPIVLLPGGLTGWQSWVPLLPALSTGRQVVRLQPIPNAQGIAGRLGDRSYDLGIERESVRITLEEMGIQDMHLVGWSNGGRMALDFALAYPDRVHTLTAIEPAAWWLAEDRCDDARGFDEFIRGCAGREITDRDVVEFLVRAGLGSAQTDFRALPGWPTWFECRNVLSWYGPRMVQTAKEGIAGFERLTAPFLLIRGKSTAPWLMKVVDILRERLPNSRIVELDGGHACILESPDAFVSAVSEHVASNDD